jgi:hypothetical protein
MTTAATVRPAQAGSTATPVTTSSKETLSMATAKNVTENEQHPARRKPRPPELGSSANPQLWRRGL